MTDYDKTNRFTLWGNKDKTEANPNWADYQGEINIDGKEYYLSAWKRKPDANPKAPPLSGTVKLKEPRRQRAEHQEQPPAASGASGDGFDDIPF